MQDRVRETSEQWDDVSAKVVGRREGVAELRSPMKEDAVYRRGWPKGVFRFRSFEESDRWLLDNVRIYRR